MNFPRLHTERLLLRQIIPQDAGMIFSGLSDPEVTAYMPIHFNHPEEIREQMVFYENHWNNQTGIFWGIEWKADGQLAGVIGIYDKENNHLKAELGFWLLRKFQGRGIAIEAAKEVTRYCFDELHLNKLYAYVETGNIASKKVMRKIRFDYEGTIREVEKVPGVEPNSEAASTFREVDLMMYVRHRPA